MEYPIYNSNDNDKKKQEQVNTPNPKPKDDDFWSGKNLDDSKRDRNQSNDNKR